jgi:hypothetical protein
MASLRRRGKVWYYRFTDADGIKREVKGCPDKRVTEEMARAAESEAAKVKAAWSTPRHCGGPRRHGGRSWSTSRTSSPPWRTPTATRSTCARPGPTSPAS